MKSHQTNVVENSHLIVSTDLEPDDILSLIMLFKELQKLESKKYPTIQFLIGEGHNPKARLQKMQEIIKAARKDGLISADLPEENFKILKGSSTTSEANETHKSYNLSFFGDKTKEKDDKGQNEDAEESRAKLKEKIEKCVKEDKKVIFFELKPFVDSIELMKKLDDFTKNKMSLIISGSYNAKVLYQENKNANARQRICGDINAFINDPEIDDGKGAILFESFHAYRDKNKYKLPNILRKYSKKERGKNKLENKLMDNFSKLMENMESNQTAIFGILKDSITCWNRPIMKACMLKCIEVLEEITKGKTLENEKEVLARFNDLKKDIKSLFENQEVDLKKIGGTFIDSLNNIIKEIPEIKQVKLTGNEKKPEDFPKEFQDFLGDKKINFVSENWDIVAAIKNDPLETLLADENCIVEFFREGTFGREVGSYNYLPDQKSQPVFTPEDKGVRLLTGLQRSQGLIDSLNEAMGICKEKVQTVGSFLKNCFCCCITKGQVVEPQPKF